MSEDLDQIAGEMAQSASHEFEERKEEQQEFLATVAEEEGAEVLETTCNLVGDYTVPLKAKFNGEIMDKMGAVDARLERIQNEEGRAYEISETADTVAQLMADVIDDPEWNKSLFYQVYKDEGLDPLGAMLETVFQSLKKARERKSGNAEGFRKK